MPLALESRHVDAITVVKCRGRIVEGAESSMLHEYVNGLLPARSYILLHLGEVDFIDSSGLGLLVRLGAKAQASHGHLKLCSVSAKVVEVLNVTRLNTILHPYASEAEAISAFYERPTSAGDSWLRPTDILCAEASVDVLVYLRELLKGAGYGVVTADNLADALILLRATRPKVVVLGPRVRSTAAAGTTDTFNRLAEGVAVVELPADFSTHDAGAAGKQLLADVRAVVAAAR